MNDEMLQRLAEEIAKQTIRDSWPMYLLLVLMTFVAASFGSYLKGRFTKRGEIAATKADADEILEQIKKTTAATKAVELSLSHGDWLQRERNTLKRTKLEDLLVCGFAIATWVSKEGRLACSTGEEQEHLTELDRFEMLWKLHLSELNNECFGVVQTYRETMMFLFQVRSELVQHQTEWNIAQARNDAADLARLLEVRRAFQERHRSEITERTGDVYRAVMTLAQASHDLMRQLVAQ